MGYVQQHHIIPHTRTHVDLLRLAVARLHSSVAAASSSQTGAAAARVATVLGTMSIPVPLAAPATREALDYFAAAGFDEIDTAIMYQGGNSEKTLGE